MHDLTLAQNQAGGYKDMTKRNFLPVSSLLLTALAARTQLELLKLLSC